MPILSEASRDKLAHVRIRHTPLVTYTCPFVSRRKSIDSPEGKGLCIAETIMHSTVKVAQGQDPLCFLDLVKKQGEHRMSEKPILYGFDGSTYVRTVRMLLAEKRVAYDQVPVNVLAGEPRQPEHLARHPFGKVPVMGH